MSVTRVFADAADSNASSVVSSAIAALDDASDAPSVDSKSASRRTSRRDLDNALRASGDDDDVVARARTARVFAERVTARVDATFTA